MMGSCFKTLLWSFLLLVLVMTVWAVIAVELIHPKVMEIADSGDWADCERCRRSFSTVMHANMTLFQTIVAGDSWGKVSIPVIEAHPWTCIIFTGSLLTLVFGVLNLIVAVIVDTFAEIRSKDMISRAHEMDCDEVQEKKVLGKIFEKIDEDNSGAVTWDELQEGARKVAEFRHWLRVLDIDAKDLHQLFQMVDADGSGEIDPEEFIEAMYRMKNAESKTATRFVKHLVTKLDNKQEDFEGALKDMQLKVSTFDETIEKSLDGITKHIIGMSQNALARQMRDQEQLIERSIQLAMKKASDVALEAALEAGSKSTDNLEDAVNRRLQVQQQRSGDVGERRQPRVRLQSVEERRKLQQQSASSSRAESKQSAAAEQIESSAVTIADAAGSASGDVVASASMSEPGWRRYTDGARAVRQPDH
mmetsp:Transcript_119481/g.254953  ORF Transcript_119481/g.254953 Transcript_119481/m.254953 type:complete len:419 (+) Transcript_119481:2-1258(+)